jgi:hypothetical protein
MTARLCRYMAWRFFGEIQLTGVGFPAGSILAAQRPLMGTQAIIISEKRLEGMMPRTFLRVLPSGARPSLFSGD